MSMDNEYRIQPQIILLKEGTDTSQGKAQVVSNINACTAVADVVCTTLGPRGMDKLIYDDKGNTTISNDGATIMKLLDIVHPAAKILVDIAKSQDSEVGDGTTTVVLLYGEFLKEAKPFIEDGAINKIKDLAVSIEGKSLEEKKSLLAKCAVTTLSSKLIGGEKEFFANMVVEAVLAIGNDDRLNLIGIKKKAILKTGQPINPSCLFLAMKGFPSERTTAWTPLRKNIMAAVVIAFLTLPNVDVKLLLIY
ncbi:T-complex protein 1 subunit eta-like [Zingiber officinale]|uniref:T-complex protein 1 subunit eta-like n=1 Tax=Zingiber officinale TaxID=94328 RepID=UPI001C4CD003|nr:T-complex protein 1 subunit eta-like [Zingiber officinale]